MSLQNLPRTASNRELVIRWLLALIFFVGIGALSTYHAKLAEARQLAGASSEHVIAYRHDDRVFQLVFDSYNHNVTLRTRAADVCTDEELVALKKEVLRLTMSKMALPLGSGRTFTWRGGQPIWGPHCEVYRPNVYHGLTFGDGGTYDDRTSVSITARGPDKVDGYDGYTQWHRWEHWHH